MNETSNHVPPDQSHFLSDLVGKKVPLNAKRLLLSEILDRRVRTQSGVKLGRLKDVIFLDDPKYAEVTALIVGRSLGRLPLRVPWVNVIDVGEQETVVQDPPSGEYSELKDFDDQLVLRDKILDKRILDLKGFDVDVVYDIQLLLVDKKLFVTAADVSQSALLRRIHLGMLAKHLLGNPMKEDIIPYRYVHALGADLTDTKGDVKLTITKENLRDIHREDIADILEELNQEERIHIFRALDSRTAADALGATEPRVQREILAAVSVERVREIFSHMSPVEIAEIISILPLDDAQEFQKILRPEVASKVHELVTQHDVPASVLAMHRFLGFPGDITVEEAFKRFRAEAPAAGVTMYVYVVDNEQHLRGVIDINELLQANPESKLQEIMTKNIVSVAPNTMRGDLRALFSRYRFRAVPVVDESKRIVGVVREKDVFLKEE
jgi:magnesium transporter